MAKRPAKKTWPTIQYHWPDGNQGTMDCDPALVWAVARTLQRDTGVYGVYVHTKDEQTFVIMNDGAIKVVRSQQFEGEYSPDTTLAL